MTTTKPPPGESAPQVWHRFPDELPPKRKLVLVQLSAHDGYPASAVVAYLKFAAGDRDCPYFVTLGVTQEGRTVEFWCDCLPEGFQAPAWAFPGLPRAVVAAPQQTAPVPERRPAREALVAIAEKVRNGTTCICGGRLRDLAASLGVECWHCEAEAAIEADRRGGT